MEAYSKRKLKVGLPFYRGIADLLASDSEIWVDSSSNLHVPVLFIFEEFHQTDVIKVCFSIPSLQRFLEFRSRILKNRSRLMIISI
jgi:hypothetical protein